MIPDLLGYFLDHFGNFGNLVKIWTRIPPNYHQHTLTNTRKYGIILITYFHIWESENSKCFEILEKRIHHVFWKIVLKVCFYIIVEYLCPKISLWRWGWANNNFSINNIHKSLDMNFISIKSMKWNFGNMYQNLFWEHSTFLESSNQNQETFFIFKEGFHQILNSR